MPKEDFSVPKLKDQPDGDHLAIPFAADKARYLDLVISPKDACLKNLESVKIYFFP